MSSAAETIVYDDEDDLSENQPPVEVKEIQLGPQPGPQTMFLETEADIAIYGGAAGGGKSYALLLEPLRHFENEDFNAVIFRRNSTQIRNAGGLWGESYKMYAPLGSHPRQSFLEWAHPSGSKLKFAHLELENSVYDWHGSQIPLIGFDELTHFTEKQFFYMMSRNRSTSGVSGYIRATCNPDCDSWVRKLIDWWIGEDGFTIPERSGVLRWFIRIEDTIHWADNREDLLLTFGEEEIPKSFTFISSTIFDNKILLEKDPAYLASLRALPRVERMRLLGDRERGGNWDVRQTAGMIFRREWFSVVDAIPSGWISVVRFWDRAATRPSEANPDPDWTRGLKMYKYPNGSFLVADLKSIRDTPGQVQRLIRTVAEHDSRFVRIVAQQDPGSAGVEEATNFVTGLVGYDVRTRPFSKDKLTRAKPVSAQAEVGNIMVLRAPWNDDFFTELEGFPEAKHDDIVDTLSGAFNELASGGSLMDLVRPG